MEKSNKYKDSCESDTNLHEKEIESLSRVDQRTVWFIASEVSGLPQMPTSDRRARDELERLLRGREHLKRRRQGTKATEYHISILPPEAQRCIFNDKWDGIDEPMGGYSIKRVTPDFMDEYELISLYVMKASNGLAIYPNIDQLDKVKYKPVSRNWLNRRCFNGNQLALIFAIGDSMMPTINNNDALVVHLFRNIPQDGNIYVFRHEDKLLVRRFQSILNTWRLITDNQSHVDLDINQEDQHQFTVVGQVVRISKDIGD
ncbi:S24 family peptidase [Shewanella baltica]|uniref:S24 family peptidase n=1 Tax=Shewanella baltica TaxID=62322 RepID=UPI003D791FF9